ncbi:serine--tRNA ligase [Candidatus Pacearchaeota archaeon]|nr:serine--tRNA ligase [Candidatus Pacearchaeota archaeon]
MLDIKFVRENPDIVKENMKKKFREDIHIVDEVLELDKSWKEIKFNEEKLRKKRNEVSKKINELKKSGKEAKKEIKEAKDIPNKIAELERKRSELEEQIKNRMMKIPNIMHESVPIGKDDSENVEIEKFPAGKPPVPDYKIFHHADTAEKLGCIDLDSARRTSGHGFYFLKGDLALLHSAMLAFARDYMVKQGFEYTIPPTMIRSEVVDGVMSFTEKDAMMYKIEGEDLYLIGTSEHSMIGKFINQTLNSRELPVKITGYSPCYRKEVGEHGIEEKGLYRVHQFEKQEMIIICEPEDSFKWYDKILNMTVKVFKELEIPIRTLEICSGDLADLKVKSADVEAWSPRQKKYFEIGSCSNLTDAQARRLNIKIENKGKKYFAHTLNNTVLASPRALIALIENNQQKDGSIKIPKVLQQYMFGKKKIEVKKKS